MSLAALKEKLPKVEVRLSVAAMAARLGVSRNAVYLWAYGKNRPNRVHRQMLKEYYGIELEDLQQGDGGCLESAVGTR